MDKSGTPVAQKIVCATKRIDPEIKALRERTRNGLDPARKEERVGDRRPKTQGTSAAGDLAPGLRRRLPGCCQTVQRPSRYRVASPAGC